MIVEPSAVPYQIELTPQGLRAVIPARRNWFVLIFLGAWLGGWFMGEVGAGRALIVQGSNAPTAFLGFWLVGWTVGGLCAAGTFLWQLAGREVVNIDGQGLSHRVEVFGFGRARTYRAADIRRLRVSPEGSRRFGNQRAWYPPVFGIGAGPVAFDYGAHTVRIAPGLEEAGAGLLVRELGSRLPREAMN